jgi:hypothetical protein
MRQIQLVLFFLSIITNLIAQCDASSLDAIRAASSYPGEEIVIIADYYSGDYALIKNITAGKRYTFRLEGGSPFNVYQKTSPSASSFTLLTPVSGEYTALNSLDFKFVGCPPIINKKLYGTCIDCSPIPAESVSQSCSGANDITNFLPYQASTPSTVSCYGTSKSVIPNPDGTHSNCGGNKDDDVWFKFRPPSSTMKIRFENVSTASITNHPDARPSIGLSWGLTTSCNTDPMANSCSPYSGGVSIATENQINEFTLSGLNTGTTYNLQIHSTDLRNTIFSRVYLFDMSLPQLPVELTQFKAQQKNNANYLTWQTASEKSNNHFDIERSAIGQEDWVKIGTVKGNGNSQIIRDYTFTDNTPLSISYYRLKQVDNDGSFDYSNVVNVTNKSGKFKIDVLLPNPTKDNLTIQFESNKNEAVNLTVLDMTGRVVLTQNASATEGGNLLNVNTASLSNGIYMVSLKNSESVILNKIVKN